ncbi:hypothetical protein MMC13_002835 [Lambiella insularis]|nr:hypothetical protein [Lambiella insularis]
MFLRSREEKSEDDEDKSHECAARSNVPAPEVLIGVTLPLVVGILVALRVVLLKGMRPEVVEGIDEDIEGDIEEDIVAGVLIVESVAPLPEGVVTTITGTVVRSGSDVKNELADKLADVKALDEAVPVTTGSTVLLNVGIMPLAIGSVETPDGAPAMQAALAHALQFWMVNTQLWSAGQTGHSGARSGHTTQRAKRAWKESMAGRWRDRSTQCQNYNAADYFAEWFDWKKVGEETNVEIADYERMCSQTGGGVSSEGCEDGSVYG